MGNREQKLIDILFEVGLTIHSSTWFETRSSEEVAEWIRLQLENNGFNVKPCGASHGKLI